MAHGGVVGGETAAVVGDCDAHVIPCLPQADPDPAGARVARHGFLVLQQVPRNPAQLAGLGLEPVQHAGRQPHRQRRATQSQQQGTAEQRDGVPQKLAGTFLDLLLGLGSLGIAGGSQPGDRRRGFLVPPEQIAVAARRAIPGPAAGALQPRRRWRPVRARSTAALRASRRPRRRFPSADPPPRPAPPKFSRGPRAPGLVTAFETRRSVLPARVARLRATGAPPAPGSPAGPRCRGSSRCSPQPQTRRQPEEQREKEDRRNRRPRSLLSLSFRNPARPCPPPRQARFASQSAGPRNSPQPVALALPRAMIRAISAAASG